MRIGLGTVVLCADLAGTVVFAAEGAMAAMMRGLDLFGIMVVAFVVALGGGMIRDVLIGAAPPSAIRDWRYPVLAFLTGLGVFACCRLLHVAPGGHVLAVLDAAGLSLFAVAGAEKALSYGIGPLAAALMGMLTGVGGGVMRDVLLARVPLILVSDIYATAALAGASVVVAGRRLALPTGAVAGAGALTCFCLRLAALRYGWRLPGGT
ncbi:trimeric intracellular cation channel family protein [Gluconacetobacter azotocaptans]|uniref:trimeric intracellular cation channel family protein n=1 Tax=Gluconacetobacter azotocaptans TaxID=142834 RepID=UPI00195779C8|nr:trimeric intracellular cation channel family protein [Gluconacetobacter azotocaptans]MBM9400427.1 trimeric intracellular cation channel family protein [Gluconacetobacter azotocaptans]